MNNIQAILYYVSVCEKAIAYKSYIAQLVAYEANLLLVRVFRGY